MAPPGRRRGVGSRGRTVRLTGRSRAELAAGLQRRARVSFDRVAWGGIKRERLLLRLLGGYYDSVFRRTWLYSGTHPHYFSQRINAFRFGLGPDSPPPEVMYRGFFSSEVVRTGDRVLDIGCGDGFFTKRFIGHAASSVDGVDIDDDAIAEAMQFNSAPNVAYTRLDAVNQPFPQAEYDAVIWDGSIGHFAVPDGQRVLEHIQRALVPGGVFAGSESLGREGEDHLQFFATTDDLAALLTPHWKHVLIREVSYPLGNDFVRREGYWRCSDDAARLRASSWVDVTSL